MARSGTEEIISDHDGLKLSLLWTEPEKMIKGVVQIAHGMSENKERYLPFMEYLAAEGYAAVIHDHRGHGKSVRSNEDLGYFYNSGKRGLTEDLYQVSCWIQQRFGQIPLYLLGHSMGTLVVRNYLKCYDKIPRKVILTGPPSRNPAVILGLLLAGTEKLILGGRHRSTGIHVLAFMPYAARFLGEKRSSAWICSAPEVVEAYDQSPYCGFVFTADGFWGLFQLLREAYRARGWKLGNPGLPILFLGGKEDPCIGGGHRFEKQIRFLKKVGYTKVTGKLYPGMRHEILNERGKEEVYANILSYLEK